MNGLALFVLGLWVGTVLWFLLNLLRAPRDIQAPARKVPMFGFGAGLMWPLCGQCGDVYQFTIDSESNMVFAGCLKCGSLTPAVEICDAASTEGE